MILKLIILLIKACDDYNLPENSTSEDIYELVDTLPMPVRAKNASMPATAVVAPDIVTAHASIPDVVASVLGTPSVTPSGCVNMLPLPPRGSSHRASPPSPPPRHRSKDRFQVLLPDTTNTRH